MLYDADQPSTSATSTRLSLAGAPSALRARAWPLLFALAVVPATLPRLLLNYGTDEDAWRSANAAANLAATGVYNPSRLPGNPLFEYVLALVVPWASHIGS